MVIIYVSLSISQKVSFSYKENFLWRGVP